YRRGNRGRHRRRAREAHMRTMIVAFTFGLALAASAAEAAPLAPKPTAIGPGAALSLELARDGCGGRWHRHHWRDQWGYWRWGDCVPDEGRPYGGYGAGTYYAPSYWGVPPRPWGW